MAVCIINPSFLTGFDFQLLHAFEGVECCRKMTYNSLRDEFICGAWGGRHEYKLTERATKITRREDVIPSTLTDNYYCWEGRFGIGRHVFQATTGTSVAGGTSGRHFVRSNDTDAYITSTNYPYANNAQGVGYAGGYFIGHGYRITVVTGTTGSFVAFQHGEDNAVTQYGASSVANAIGTVSSVRHAIGRGQWLYGALYSETPADIFAGRLLGMGKKALPLTASPVGAVSQRFTRLAQFNADGTAVEVADLIDYPVDFSDGFAMVERDGTMWRVTAADAGGWHKGAAPETELTGYTFSHLAHGKGRFGEDLLVTLDSTGSLGLVSLDGGDSHIVFELPSELGQTIPGGIAIPTGADDGQRLQRCYDLQYIETPEEGNGKGKWILLAGFAVFEMIPRYK